MKQKKITKKTTTIIQKQLAKYKKFMSAKSHMYDAFYDGDDSHVGLTEAIHFKTGT